MQVLLQTLMLGLEYLYTFIDCAHGHCSSSRNNLRVLCTGHITPRAQHYTHLEDRAQCSSHCYNALSLTTERSMAMSDWVAAELAECQMHDVRHTKRLARLLGRLSEHPVGSISTACHGWAETVAAYRFL